MTPDEIVARAREVFAEDVAGPPPLTLRGGSAVDSYEDPPPYDSVADDPTDAYLEEFSYWGLIYLDARSWRHYLPRLIEYAFRHPDDPKMVTEALLNSLRPPDRSPPRLATLTADQESVVTAFLESLVLTPGFPEQEDAAAQALAEWWGPEPRHRPSVDVVGGMLASVVYREAGNGPYRILIPETFRHFGPGEIPEESRTAESWSGYLGGSWTQITVQRELRGEGTLRQAARRLAARLRSAKGDGQPTVVPGVKKALRLDGTTGPSPAEPESITFIFADTGEERLTLVVKSSWPRDDVATELERIVASFRVLA